MATMKEAEAKSAKRWYIGASIVVGIIFLLFILPVPTFFHGYFKRADTGFKVAGVILAGGWYWFLWVKSADVAYGRRSSAAGVQIILVVWLALACACLGGFNFDLRGIE